MTNTALLALSGLLVVAYLLDVFGRRFRLPSVVLLIASGIVARQLMDRFDVHLGFVKLLLPVIGTIGLILIVLEGGLDLNLKPGRRRFLLLTFGAATAGVLLTTAALALALHLWLGLDGPLAALVAVPFAVISSAVAIPSAEVLPDEDREYVIYESSWSDIVGVMVFNAVTVVAVGGVTRGDATLGLFGGGLAVLVLGVLIGLAVYWLVGHLQGHVKFLPLIFALILVYTGAKVLHLSPLLIVLILGLLLNNPHLFLRRAPLQRLHGRRYWAELDKLKHLTAEATFFVRTFFFLLLGYSTDLATLADARTWLVAVALVAAIFILRVPVIALLSGSRGLRPLLWAAPRGLITVLLFLTAADTGQIEGFPFGAVMLVVLVTATATALAHRGEPESAPADAESPAATGVKESSTPP
jgi:NhaP-type Na+/H+ or K+/H+ antiporter